MIVSGSWAMRPQIPSFDKLRMKFACLEGKSLLFVNTQVLIDGEM
jgi:hypothetical protein